MNVDLPPDDLSPGPRAMPLASLGVFFAIFVFLFSVDGTIAVWFWFCSIVFPAAKGFCFLRPFLCGAGVCFWPIFFVDPMYPFQSRKAPFNLLRLQIENTEVKNGFRSGW